MVKVLVWIMNACTPYCLGILAYQEVKFKSNRQQYLLWL